MNIQRFIDRPILSIVISVVIVVAGVIGLSALAVEQYPDMHLLQCVYPQPIAVRMQRRCRRV